MAIPLENTVSASRREFEGSRREKSLKDRALACSFVFRWLLFSPKFSSTYTKKVLYELNRALES